LELTVDGCLIIDTAVGNDSNSWNDSSLAVASDGTKLGSSDLIPITRQQLEWGVGWCGVSGGTDAVTGLTHMKGTSGRVLSLGLAQSLCLRLLMLVLFGCLMLDTTRSRSPPSASYSIPGSHTRLGSTWWKRMMQGVAMDCDSVSSNAGRDSCN